MRLVLSLSQRFCQTIPAPNMLSFYDVINPSSLSQNELKHLHTFESYQNCMRSFNANRIQDSINYIQRTQLDVEKSIPSEVNMRSFLLNIQSLLYKMETDEPNLQITLKKLFLLYTSYFGFTHSSYKHFQNYFLSLLYSKRQLASGLINYIKYQDIPDEFRNRVSLLQSILYSLKEETQKLAKEKAKEFQPENKQDEVILHNNLAWIQLWNTTVDPNKKGQEFDLAALTVLKSLKIAELEDTVNYIKERSPSQQLALKYLLENHENVNALSKGKSFDALKFIHKHSHIISMNLGQLMFLAGKQQESSLWLQLSSKAGVDYQEFIRITRGLMYTGRIFVNNGLPDEAESMYLGVLKHYKQLPTHSLQSVLLNYSGFLQKTQRYYEAQQYLNQVGNMGDFQEEQRLDRLLVPDYNFLF